eukprot:141931-Chlamydomonas_euryale.AAC.1
MRCSPWSSTCGAPHGAAHDEHSTHSARGDAKPSTDRQKGMRSPRATPLTKHPSRYSPDKTPLALLP